MGEKAVYVERDCGVDCESLNGDFVDVEKDCGIGCEGTNGMDSWEGELSICKTNENGKATENDKELERYEPLMMGGGE